MRVVVTLGGNTLLRRGEPLTAENQRAHARVACKALAPLALEHEDPLRQRRGGGGIPVMYTDEPAPAGSRLVGVEAVIDKDLASALLVKDLHADALVIVTDVDAVYMDWGTPTQRAIRRRARAHLPRHLARTAPENLRHGLADDLVVGNLPPRPDRLCCGHRAREARRSSSRTRHAGGTGRRRSRGRVTGEPEPGEPKRLTLRSAARRYLAEPSAPNPSPLTARGSPAVTDETESGGARRQSPTSTPGRLAIGEESFHPTVRTAVEACAGR